MTRLQRQQRQMGQDVAWLIRQSGQTAILLHPQVAGTDSFYGPHDAAETEVGVVPIEMTMLSPKDLAEIGADAVASVLPESGVQEQDMLDIGGTRYRVTEVMPYTCFGVVTHCDLHLEREHREADHG